MVFFQEPLSVSRFLTIYIAQGLVFALFLFLAFKILKRDRKRLNVIFAGFYLSPVIGLFVNFIYGPLSEESVIIALNFITNFGIFYAPIFLVVFELILLKSEKVITSSKQLIILILYGIAMFSMIFFLFIPEWGVSINESTNWSPKWSFPFFFYLVIIESIAVLPILFLSFRISQKFEDELLKKKWNFFIFGFCALAIFMYGIFVSNFLGIDIFRLIMGLIGLILAIIGGYLMYYGVGRQIEK